MINVIFDFDGTLFNSKKSFILKCRDLFSRYYSEEEVTLKTAKCLKYVGIPAHDILEQIGIDKDRIKEMLALFPVLNNKYNRFIVPFNGISTLLANLKEFCNLFIVSHRNRRQIINCLNKYSLTDYFIQVVGTVEQDKYRLILDLINKHKLNYNKTILVGDSCFDVLAAIKAQIFPIAVSWGYCGLQELKDINYGIVVKNINSLQNLLTNINAIFDKEGSFNQGAIKNV